MKWSYSSVVCFLFAISSIDVGNCAHTILLIDAFVGECIRVRSYFWMMDYFVSAFFEINERRTHHNQNSISRWLLELRLEPDILQDEPRDKIAPHTRLKTRR